MKGKSIVEASLIFLALQVVLLYPGVRNLIRWENNVLGGSYFTGLLMVALGVFVVIIRRYEFRLIGVVSENWRLSVNHGIRGYLFFLIPQLSLSFFSGIDARYQDYLSTAIILDVMVLTMCYFMFRAGLELQPATDRMLTFAGLLMLSPLLVGLFTGELTLLILKEYAWNILVGGFVEEYFYRGYIQSSVNLEYVKEWKIGKTSFGPGLLVSALLYGLSRGLRTVRPLSGVYSISWSWTLFAFIVGIFYGLIREASGDIIASGTANSMIDAIGEAMSKVF